VVLTLGRIATDLGTHGSNVLTSKSIPILTRSAPDAHRLLTTREMLAVTYPTVSRVPPLAALTIALCTLIGELVLALALVMTAFVAV